MAKHKFPDSIKRDLQQAKTLGFKVNAELIATHCCAECDKVDGQTLPLEQVLKENPLPVASCTRKGGCICCYGFVPIRDDSGRLIDYKY